MLWNAKARISTQMHENSKEIFHYMHIIGIFPFVIKPSKDGLILKWSPCWAIYSYALGTVFVTMSTFGLFQEFCYALSVNFYETDVIAGFIALSGYTVVIISGIFATPSRYSRFFNYITCLNEIDTVISTVYIKHQRYKSLIIVNALLIYNVVGIIIDCYFYYESEQKVGGQNDFTIFLVEFVVLYLNSLTRMMEYAHWHLVNSLGQRIKRLNKLLESECARITRITQSQGELNWKKLQAHVSKNHQRIEVGPSANVVELRKAFLIILDSADALNDLLGSNILMLLLSICAITTFNVYLIILTLEGKKKSLAELVAVCMFLGLYVSGALLLTEPCHSCLLLIEETKRLVCKLLSLKLDQYHRKQVKIFAKVLCLRQLNFSVYGFFEVNRLFYTFLIGAVTTYVAIFLQSQEDETN